MARFGLAWGEITHLLVTHFHTDHVGGIAPLLFALNHGLGGSRKAPLTVLGPSGIRDHLEALSWAHGPHILDPGFPVEVHELAPQGTWENPGGEFRVYTRSTRHTLESLGVRIETEDGALGFTGDTGPDPELGPFFRGCQILLAECSHPDGHEMETHLTPGGLAAIAGTAFPDVLVPVHCYPALDPETVPDLLAQAGYEGLTLPGRDGLRLDLTGGVVEVQAPQTE
jgi:ribonuclease BN (tRNA processing enzyme)